MEYACTFNFKNKYHSVALFMDKLNKLNEAFPGIHFKHGGDSDYDGNWVFSWTGPGIGEVPSSSVSDQYYDLLVMLDEWSDDEDVAEMITANTVMRERLDSLRKYQEVLKIRNHQMTQLRNEFEHKVVSILSGF